MESELVSALSEYVAANGGADALSFTPLDGVVVLCSTQTRLPFRRMYKPSLCVVVQGAKRIEVADRALDYAAGSALAVSVEVPAYGGVTQASKEKPFLGLTIDFDTELMRAVLERLPEPPIAQSSGTGLFVETLSEAQRDCIARLVRLFSMPKAVPVLYPAIIKELYYWLLTGPNGTELGKMVQSDGHARRIADAIIHMRQDFKRQWRIAELAEVACMSSSSFHQHFKTLTSMTPLQYQKHLRLMEARRLMVTEAANVTRAALEVGYESPSQFSREYSRLFGCSPKRDVTALRPYGAQLSL
ncbi:AraC family transcriptional regulator [Pelagibacterium sp. H642]|uniref:AraC family transcriptional regulator n=1 Tax=Pelagibacterium sp. H642 TaxID=1881069 RepID=UPI0028168311|nr:AraC family transcriptional regulator [Pelagibacterium sp. H642]WMT91934.1 AraC family transcriptional regulator [Pelagibacterium sp. H642]